MDSSYSHKELKEICERGESVLIGGRVVTSPSDLPSAAALAKGKPSEEAATTKTLDEQIAELTKQRDSLKSEEVSADQESSKSETLPAVSAVTPTPATTNRR